MSHTDTVVRTALMLMVLDPASALTDIQRTWLRERLAQCTALTSAEKTRLQPGLLAWVRATQPRIYDIVARQCEATPTTM
jgi:uncharacterized protein YecT (DUF1311 family)